MKNLSLTSFAFALTATALTGCLSLPFGGGREITYVQWNIGHFAMGKSSRTTLAPEQAAARAAEYHAMLAKLDADVIGVSEWDNAFDTAKTPARSAVFGGYPNVSTGPANSYQWNAMLTREWPFKDIQVHDYKERLQKVYWLDNVCEIDGKEVHFVQTHLDWNINGACVSNRKRQIRELVAAFRDTPYVVISADFNVYRAEEYDQFKAAGFELANCGARGNMRTVAGRNDPSLPRVLDNIVVKGFRINDAQVFDEEMELSDHMILRAKLEMLPAAEAAPAVNKTHLVYPMSGLAPSLLPEGDWDLVWHDEFETDRFFDSRWGYRTNFWGKTAHWFAKPEDQAVEIKDGVCRLKIVKRPDGQFVSPQLQTGELLWDNEGCVGGDGFWKFPKRREARFMKRYGYFECRCKLQKMPGWWSAFWMQSPANGASLDPEQTGIEQDIMESFHPGKIMRHAFHTMGYGADYKGFCTPRPVNGKHAEDIDISLDQFHVFGLLWEEDGYTVFVDGVQHGEKVGCGYDEYVSKVPAFLLISTECKWYRHDGCTGKGVPELEAAWKAGDSFDVDYVRVYERK